MFLRYLVRRDSREESKCPYNLYGTNQPIPELHSAVMHNPCKHWDSVPLPHFTEGQLIIDAIGEEHHNP